MSIDKTNNRKRIGLHFGLLGCALFFILSGCATTMSGAPDSANKPGILYYLPAPHIFFNPHPDGTVEVEVKYLRDPNNAYTLNVSSFLSNTTFEVTTKDGLLKTLKLNTDASEFAEKALDAGLILQQAKMKAKKDEKDAEKQKADAREASIKTAAEGVLSKKEGIAVLDLEIQFYKKNGGITDKDLMAKELALSKAKLELEQLENRLGGLSSSNAPGAGAALLNPGKNFPTAYGPVLFRVLQKNGKVKLVALEEGQRKFQTSKSGAKPSSTKSTLTISPSAAIVKKSDTDHDISFTFSESITLVKNKAMLRQSGTGVTGAAVLSGTALAISMTDADSKILKVVLPSTLPKGKYELDITFNVKGNNNSGIFAHPPEKCNKVN